MVVDMDGRPCQGNCPNRGCLESVASGTALAADTPPASDDLAEVIVTAQFREQNVQDTPLAITAISAGMLESRSQTNVTELTAQAPNVTLKQQGATFGPSIAASIASSTVSTVGTTMTSAPASSACWISRSSV